MKNKATKAAKINAAGVVEVKPKKKTKAALKAEAESVEPKKVEH